MIAVIRIHGMIKVNEDVQETLFRMRLRKKYTCVFLEENDENLGRIKMVKDFVAFGNVDEKIIAEVIKARGKKIGDVKAKVSEADAVKAAKEIIAGKKLEDLKIKPWFGLHPARGGINTKKYYPKGVLGNHKEDISKLIMKML